MLGAWVKIVKKIWQATSILLLTGLIAVSLACCWDISPILAIVVGLSILAGLALSIAASPKYLGFLVEDSKRLENKLKKMRDARDPKALAARLNSIRMLTKKKFGESKLAAPIEADEIIKAIGLCQIDLFMEVEMSGIDAAGNPRHDYVGWKRLRQRTSTGMLALRRFHRWAQEAFFNSETKKYYLLDSQIQRYVNDQGEKALYLYAQVSSRPETKHVEVKRTFHLFLREIKRGDGKVTRGEGQDGIDLMDFVE